jgi:hypothetical protein
VARASRVVHITAPRERVFALASDPARIAGIDPRVGRVTVEGDPSAPRCVRLEFTPGGGAPAAEIVADVTRYVAGRDFAVASAEGAPGPVFRLALSCRDAGDGTDLTCEIEVRMPGFAGRVADPLLGAALTQQVGVLLARVAREATRAAAG